MEKKVRSGEPDIYQLLGDDLGMNDAILQARNSLNLFDRAILTNKYDTGTSALKVRFETANGGEHIWVTDISIISGIYYGIVDNLPDDTIPVELNKGLQIDSNNISDWMYVENGKLRGGFTIRYIRSKLSPQEKVELDSTCSFEIDE